MAEKEIRLGGIERNLSPANNADGAMEMLVGWRFSDGNLRPAPIPSPIEDIEYLSKEEDLIYVHKYDNYKHYIVYDGIRRIIYSPLYYCEENGTVCERIEIRIFSDVDKPSSVCSIGNILIFCFNTVLMRALRVNEPEYGYKYIVIGEMKLPLVTFKQETKNSESQQNIYYESDRIDIVPEERIALSQIVGNSYPHVISNKYFINQLTDSFASLLANFRYMAARENVLVDSYLVRYGFRLYDGEYLYLSPPILVRGESYKMWTDSAVYSKEEKIFKNFQGCRLGGNGYKLLISLSNVDELDKMIENRFYVAIDVFFSLPIPTYDSSRRIDSVTALRGYDADDGSGTYYYIEWGSSILPKVEDIEQYFNFYRVFSIGSDEIRKYKEKLYNEFNINDKIEIISQLPLLEYVNAPHTYNANGIYVYNGRLHAYNVKDVLFSGFELPYFSFIRDFGGEHVYALSASKRNSE